jgi:hypothetical protein
MLVRHATIHTLLVGLTTILIQYLDRPETMHRIFGGILLYEQTLLTKSFLSLELEYSTASSTSYTRLSAFWVEI